MSGLRFAYGTNGMADHRLPDALAMLADLGYAGVALTLDHHHLDPFADDIASRIRSTARLLDRHGLDVVIETGARFILDPRRKHRPSLLCDHGAERRMDLLHRAIEIGADLGATAVSMWSGTRPRTVGERLAWSRLVDGCAELLDDAAARGVRLGLEPEPGMFVDRLDRYDELVHALGPSCRLGLTLDIGHCRCVEEQSVSACVRRAGARVVNVHIEDMRRGEHEHLDFGAGEIDFPPVLAALREIGYPGLVGVELPRHSHRAHEVVPAALTFLRNAERRTA